MSGGLHVVTWSPPRQWIGVTAALGTLSILTPR